MRGALFLLVILGTVACGTKKKASAPLVNTDTQKEWYYQGEMEYQNGNYAEADSLFSKFVRKAPQPASGYYRLACLKQKQGRFDTAILFAKKAASLDTANRYAYEIFQADVYRASRDYTAAAKIYQHWAVKKGNYWSLFQDAVRMYQAAGSFNNVIQLCNQWENSFGVREEIANNAAWAYQRKGAMDSAAMQMAKLVKKYPERRQYKLLLATALIDAGKPEEAMAIYRELLAADPGNAEILLELCRYFGRTNDYKSVWQIASKVAESKLSFEQKRSCLQPILSVENYQIPKDSIKAILVTLARLHAESSLPWQMLGDMAFRERDFAGAANPYYESVRRFSNYEVWTKLTECENRLRNFESAIRFCDTLQELYPSNPRVYALQAEALLGNMSLAKAREAAETGISFAVEPADEAELKLLMARILNVSGKRQEALDMVQKQLSQFPEAIPPKLTMAGLYLQNGVRDSAEFYRWIRAAESGLKNALQPEDIIAEIALLKAQMQIIQGNAAKALAILDVLLPADPNNDKAWELKGDACLAAGNIPEADKAYKTSFHLNPFNMKALNKGRKLSRD